MRNAGKHRIRKAVAAFGLILILALGVSEPGLAQSSGSKPLSSFSESSDKPIDITADRLDVAHDEKVATFSGNVKAVQGDITLHAPVLKVYYDANGGSNGTPAGRKGRGDGGGNPSIRRLEATGGVLLQSPQETARGQHAVYDVANRTAIVVGNVVLTRQENTIKGERLTINFDSGQSRIEGGTPATGGRVHGVFRPQNRNGNPGAASAPGPR